MFVLYLKQLKHPRFKFMVPWLGTSAKKSDNNPPPPTPEFFSFTQLVNVCACTLYIFNRAISIESS